MSETKSVTFKVGGWIGTFAYLACGMLYHLVMSDTPFSWGDPWLYVDMALWPFWLFGWFILLIIAIIVIVAAVFGGAGIMDWFDRRKRLKDIVKRNARREQEQEEERRRIAKATPSKS